MLIYSEWPPLLLFFPSWNCSCGTFSGERGNEYQCVITACHHNLSSPPATATTSPIRQPDWAPRLIPLASRYTWQAFLLYGLQLRPESQKVHKRRVSQSAPGALPTSPADTGEAWGDYVKQYTSSTSSACLQSCLQSRNCTSLLIQGCRDSSCGLELRKSPNWALNHIKPLYFKHVRAEMEIELVSAGFRPRGEDAAVAAAAQGAVK